MNEKKWLYDFRVAYKRLTNKYKKDTEEYFNSVVWLGKLSLFRKKQKDENKIDYDSTFDCVRNFYKKSYEDLKHRTDAELKGAEDYVKEMHFSKEEAKEWIERIQKKIERALNDFDTLFGFNLKLFDFKPTENHDVETDYDYIRNIIKKLFVKNSLEIYPIETIRIINAKGIGIGKFQDKYLSSDSSFDFLTSGTYFWIYGKLGWCPVASVITESSVFENLEEPKNKRGGLAILNSGIINIRYTNNNEIENIKEKFRDILGSEIGEREIPELKGEYDIEKKLNLDNVFEFIGGGALLINNKKAISGEELYKFQQFDNLLCNMPSGFHSAQLQNAVWRVMVAKLNEIPFFIITNNKPEELQKVLYDLGFSELVCFDGGNEVFVADKENDIKGIRQNSPSGFAVKVERKYE